MTPCGSLKMHIAILSDIHDHITNLTSALSKLGKADALICCGDLCSPFIVVELGQQFLKPIHIVFGNNDGDLFRITQQATRFSQITLHGEFADLTLGGKRIGVTHFPNIAGAIALSNRYDLVCYGHNHILDIANEGSTSLVNPGEVFGGLTGKATFVIYNTDTGIAKSHQIL